MSQDDNVTESGEPDFLSTVEGEISFFRSIMRARPVGVHRAFHLLAIRSWIHKDTGHFVTIDEIRDKLESCYNMDALETLDLEGYDSPDSNDSAPAAAPSPSPSQNLAAHPHFHAEFALPSDDAFYAALVAKRRVRGTASPPSSPSSTVGKRTRRRKSKVELAGLVGGDSDSSALTQESGDEGGDPTDAGSEDAEGVEEGTVRSHSPAANKGKKPKTPAKKNGGPVTRTTRATSSKPAKKKKRGG